MNNNTISGEIVNGRCTVADETRAGGSVGRKAYGSAISAAIFYTMMLWIWRPVIRIGIDREITLTLWHGTMAQWLRWPLVVLGVVLSALTLITGRLFCHRDNISGRLSKVMVYLHSICLLPLIGVVLLLVDLLPPAITANAILYIPAAAVAWALVQWTTSWDNDTSVNESRREWTWHILIVSTLLYAALGYFIASTAGEHVGDEGHYLVQAESLFNDHDLDIKNNVAHSLDKIPKWSNPYAYLHLSPNSRGDNWYSYHPFGISLLMAPIWPLGMPGRYILLALIAAAGNVGMYRLSRIAGAGRNAALLAVAGLGCSFYWATYAGRALPEMLGATLLSWLFWAIAIQERRQWISAVLAAFCCAYLVAAHERFVPLSLMGFGFYGLFGLCSKEKWKRKLLRLTVFTLLCTMAYGLFVLSQFAMFQNGMKYSLKGAVLTFPLGMWAIIAGSRGIVSIFAAFIWFVAALFVWVFSKRRGLLAVAIPATILVCFVSSCGTPMYRGGACVPGRYLLVVVPLFVPCVAGILDTTNSTARWWFAFLASASAVLLTITLLTLESFGRRFILPINAVQSVHPLFVGIFNPHSSFVYTESAAQLWVVSLYVAAAILMTAICLAVPKQYKRYASFPLILACSLGIFAHAFVSGQNHKKAPSPRRVAKHLGHARHGNMKVFLNTDKPLSLYDISRIEFPDFEGSGRTVGVTTENLGLRVKGRMISQPYLERNDWAGRGFRWATLTSPFSPAHGRQILHIEGKMDGDAKLLLAVKEGSRIRYEGTLPVEDGKVFADIVFECSGFAGDLYILAYLAEGEGTFELEKFYRSPFRDGFMNHPKIFIPGNRPLLSSPCGDDTKPGVSVSP